MAISSKILVKVGKQSKVKFRGAQAFRAITLDELDTLSRLNPDASIVVIENIKANEDEQLKGFIAKFEAVENNKVFFFVEDNDDATCGVADELAYDIYLNIKDLYRAIKINCNITVDTDISLSNEFIGSSGFDDGFSNSFDDALETINNTNKKEIEELPSIETKDDLSDFDTSVMSEDSNEDLGVGETKEAGEKDLGIEETKEAGGTEGTKAGRLEVGSREVEETTVKKVSDLEKQATIEEKQSNIAEIEKQASIAEIEKLEKTILDLEGQLHKAIDKSKALSELTRAIEVERDTFKNRLKLYNENTVLEEPISLAQYQELENRIKYLTENSEADAEAAQQVEDIKSLLESVTAEKEEAERKLSDYKERLKESAVKLSDTLDKVKSTEAELQELKDKASENESKSVELESAQSESAIYKQEIEKLKGEITESNKLFENAKIEIDNIAKERESLLVRIECEVNSRLFITNTLFESVKRISELTLSLENSEDRQSELSNTITELNNLNEENTSRIEQLQEQLESFKEAEVIIANLTEEKEELYNKYVLQSEDVEQLNNNISAYETRVAELEEELAEVDKRIDLAHKFSKEELDRVKMESLEWQTKFNVAQSQFTSKEAQYNTLIQSVGMNENGVNSLLENNRTMDEINRTLRDQIVMLKTDLEKASRDKVFAQQTASALEESNKNMRVSMKAMSVGMSGGINVSSGIPPFQYQGRGMVIPVFGCGSFGITTTAMSIAHKLSAQARVLYVDFDMVSPKADSWFKSNPLIRGIPDVEPNSVKATGLGLLVDKQIQYFLNNSSAIILKPVQTKSGCIDYISGFYSKPDAIKLMSTDFASFINYCGNSYTYVIIDFGRLGSSDINDQIIKAFCDIAYRSVVVTTSNKFEIRTFRMKLSEARIDINNIAWLVNMCERTNIEDTAKKAISPAMYSLMPLNMDLYGKELNFTKDKLTRDKLSLFIDKTLFRN